MDKLITERDEEAIDADLKSMVEAAQRAEAKNSRPALSPLHEVGFWGHTMSIATRVPEAASSLPSLRHAASLVGRAAWSAGFGLRYSVAVVQQTANHS